MIKITKKAKQEYIREKLSTDPKWALRALIVIYNNQTTDEQEIELTCHSNNIGFTGADATFLTSVAKQYMNKGYLSERQMYHVFRKIPKYCRQILNESDDTKLTNILTQ